MSRDRASGSPGWPREARQAEPQDAFSTIAGPGTRRRYFGARGAGQGIVEYGLILAIMIVVCIAALVFFGDQLAAILGFIASKV